MGHFFTGWQYVGVRLLGIFMILGIGLLGCMTVRERHYLIYSPLCLDGDSVCCTFERDSVQARVVTSSTDGYVLTVGVELVNRRNYPLIYRVNELAAWENQEPLQRAFAPEVNGMPCSSCSVLTINQEPSYVFASFKRPTEKDQKKSTVLFELGNLYRDSVKAMLLPSHTVQLDKFTSERYMLVIKPGLR